MRRRKRTGEMKGQGKLSFENHEFTVHYRIDVDQEFLTSKTFGSSQTSGGLKDLSGWVEVQGDDLIDTFNSRNAVLQLSDGKRIGILLELSLKPERELSFSLRDAMDLRL